MKFFHRRKVSLNRALLELLREHDKKPPTIRATILAANEIKKVEIKRLVNGEASQSMVYGTLHGVKRNRSTMRTLSEKLDLPVEELFPEAK